MSNKSEFKWFTKKELKKLHVLVLVTHFSIDDVVSEIKTLYCKPNIRHLPAAVYYFGPVEAFRYGSPSQTTSSLRSLTSLQSFFSTFFPYLLFFRTATDSFCLLFPSVLFFPSVHYQNAWNNVSSWMCLELQSSPERLLMIQRGQSCFIVSSFFNLNVSIHLPHLKKNVKAFSFEEERMCFKRMQA